jgi:glycosyltransferase involved in cell wall biosynthesis
MRIGIVGTRGIPNSYGGFEQFAQHLSVGLVNSGAEVWVYNSHNHPYKEKEWNGVNIVHCYDPESAIGTAGQFIYDFNCIRDSRKRQFDIILQLGYTSSSIWCWLQPKKAKVLTNMDGIEWKRSKYSKIVQRFIRLAEKLAIKTSHTLVADSEAIKKYLMESHGVDSVYIPYGADVPLNVSSDRLVECGVEPQGYFLLIARMQPDNHVEEIIKGVLSSKSSLPLLVIGNVNNKHGKYLTSRYSGNSVRFLGGIFDIELLNQLRHHSLCYFHGHSAGGTNPSLLEAMASSAYICAHDNPFNRAVLGENASYFSGSNDIAKAISNKFYSINREKQIAANLTMINNKYSWNRVIGSYNFLFKRMLSLAQ